LGLLSTFNHLFRGVIYAFCFPAAVWLASPFWVIWHLSHPLNSRAVWNYSGTTAAVAEHRC